MKPILQMLQTKIIPWTKSEDRQLVLARPIMENADLPLGTSLSQRPLKGKPVIVKRRHLANQRSFMADWPESNQQEMALPKLACVVHGSADYLLGNYCLHASEGAIILIPPHTPHHRIGPFLDRANRQHGNCIMLFAYAYSHGIFLWFSHSADDRHINDKTNNYLIPNQDAVQLLNIVMEEAATDEAQSEALCKSMLFAFFTILTREIKAGRCMSVIPQEQVQTLTDEDFTNQVQKYIRANLHKRLKVEDIAGHMYMSSSHFSRMIRRETGASFVELLTRCRIERAQELLKETDWIATSIANYVGLKSTAYFHDLFKQHVGCSPIEYRQKHQK